MKTKQELAQMRADVKRALRREAHRITGKFNAAYLLNTREQLHHDERLLDSLERVRFNYSRSVELFEYNSYLQTDKIIRRDQMQMLIDWFRTNDEGIELATKWDLQADIITGRKANI